MNWAAREYVFLVVSSFALFAAAGCDGLAQEAAKPSSLTRAQSPLFDSCRTPIPPTELGRADAEKREAECRARVSQWMNLSPDERNKIIQDKLTLADETIKKMEERAKSEARNQQLKPSELGIFDEMDPTLLGKEYNPPVNGWIGYINNTLVQAGGSNVAANPKQGVLFVMEAENISSSKVYPTPTATGPVKIVAENNGILTLKSIAGTNEMYSETDARVSGGVKTPGGDTYYFNLITRQFR
jgi:hypothetical protein